MTRILQVGLALAIAVLAFSYALWGVDFVRLRTLLAHADYRLLVPFLGFVALFFLFTGWRWNLILRSLGRYSLRQSGPAMMVGFAGNNVLPAHLGEFARAIVFSRQFGVPASAVMMTLVVERMLDVLAILVFYLVAVFWIDPFPEHIRLGAEAAAAVMAVASVAIVLFLRYPLGFVRLWEHLSRWLPLAVQARGSAMLHNAGTGLTSLKSPWMLAVMVLHSLLKWAACGAEVSLALLAFGHSVPYSVSLIVLAVIVFAVTLPTAPGFLGTMQAAFVIALVPFGVSQETALAASVFYLVAQWVPVTLVGAFCFAATGLHLRDVRREAERLEHGQA